MGNKRKAAFPFPSVMESIMGFLAGSGAELYIFKGPARQGECRKRKRKQREAEKEGERWEREGKEK